ncbi:MAG TPA: carbohydrate kinase family protein [Candidatus Latescibacteria bacterium]|nr:carbohydrate kinase family protein [Candidatus Latescibacterota bacterium]
MFDLVGCGALNLDLFYRIEDLGFLRKWGMVHGGEVLGGPSWMDEFLKELGKEGEFLGRSGGGSAANTAFALAKMSFRTGFLGMLGDDPEGDFVLSSLEGVDTSLVGREGRTGVCVVVLTPDGERSTVLFPGANDLFRTRKEELRYASRSKWIHLTSFVGEEAFQAQAELVRSLPDEVRISFDPGHLYALKGMEALKSFLERAEVLFATEVEVELLTGREFREGARVLRRSGPRIVIVKLGPRGAWTLAEDEWETPAPKAEVRDSTGAGDVLAAGFLAGLLRGWSPKECLEFGVGLASRSVEGYGREAYPEVAP